MNLHEYQGKELLNSFGVRIQRGIVKSSPEEAVKALRKFTSRNWYKLVCSKAQIHAGGRGKRWWSKIS